MTNPTPNHRERQIVHKTITVPSNLRKACDEFNGGMYFECHETLEEIWQEEEGEVRDLYKGLIQVAAAFVHIGRNNHFGAQRLLTTAIGYLAPYRGEGAMGFDVDRICRDAQRVLEAVNELGEGRVVETDGSLAPAYEFDAAAIPSEARRWGAWGFSRDGSALDLEITVVE